MISTELQKRILSSIILIPIVIYFVFLGSFYFIFFLGIFFLITSFEWIKMNKKDLVKIIGILYLIYAFYTAYIFREKYSFGVFILILIICIFTDIGGYVFGKTLKGPKLSKISPKKTYAGVFGGYISSLIVVTLYIKLTSIGAETYLNLSKFNNENFFSDNMFFLLVLIISFVNQVGDLIISYFKRIAKVKDTGKLLPGHGGLLDRIDGIIFAVPMSYLLINI